MESMLNLQVHNLATVIDRFVPYILCNAVIHNELKVVPFSIMCQHRVVFVPSVYQPPQNVSKLEIVLFTVHVLCYHKICFVDACFLHRFDIKEDVLITRSREFCRLKIALMRIHVYPLFTTRTLSGVTHMVFKETFSVSSWADHTFCTQPLLADCFQMVVNKAWTESPIAEWTSVWCRWRVSTITQA